MKKTYLFRLPWKRNKNRYLPYNMTIREESYRVISVNVYIYMKYICIYFKENVHVI